MSNWTDNQRTAITQRGQNLLVSAAAGSGKTAVLVERIIQLVTEENVSVENLLVVTFTRAAAEEMKERISVSLRKRMETAQGEQRQFLVGQMHSLPYASISTIHSFCNSVVRKYAHVVGLDPGITIGNETVLSILKQRALEEVLEKEYEEGTPGFFRLLESFGDGRQDTRLREILFQYYQFLMNRPDPQTWSRNSLAQFQWTPEEFDQSLFYQSMKEFVGEKLSHGERILEEAFERAALVKNAPKVQEILGQELFQLQQLKKGLEEGFAPFHKGLLLADFDRLTVAKDDPDLKKRITDLRDEGKKLVKGLKDDLTFETVEVLFENLREMGEVMKDLDRLVYAFHRSFQELKADKGILDFNDLEHFALQVLQTKEAVEELQQEYEYIFIDEYQDSNQIQDAISEKIRRENNLFLVGDVKQSIYRFRLSDPGLFLDKNRRFQKEEDPLSQVIHLNTNFRSNPTVVGTINRIFCNVMNPLVGEIEYDEKEQLYCGLEVPTTPLDQTEIHIIQTGGVDVQELVEGEEPAGEADDELEDLSTAEMEAALAAQRIAELVGTPVYDGKQQRTRPLEYRDMVILLRSVKVQAPVFQEVLMERGIPVHAQSGMGYFQTLEIALILDLLALIDNRQQDLPLLAVLRSPIFSFSLKEITTIRSRYPKGLFWQSVDHYKNTEEDELAGKLKGLFDRLTQWKHDARILPLERFLWSLMMETHYYHYVGALPGGVQRQANLRILIDRARSFRDSALNGLFQFIQFVKELKDADSDLEMARVLGPMENVVRIMSIHKSKGLEFPLVMVGGLGKRFNMQDLGRPLLLHKDLGICPDYVNLEERRRCTTLFKNVAKEKITLEVLSEEMRILYVALTRAQNKLILLGCTAINDKKWARWEAAPTPYGVSKGRTALDWVMSALLEQGHSYETTGKVLEHPEYSIQITPKEVLRRGKEDRSLYTKKVEQWLKTLKGREDTSSGEVAARLQWQYPKEDALGLPRKMSVTEVRRFQETRKWADPVVEIKLPLFLTGETPKTGAEIGSANHFVLQNMDLESLTRAYSLEEGIREGLQDLVRRGLLQENTARLVQVEGIARFFAGSLGQRLLKAEKVERERRFTMELPKVEVAEAQDVEGILLVQGMVDCFFLEGDQWVLVDYKSDYFANETEKKRKVDAYQNQIHLYKRAIETATGRRVKEAYLYLLYTGEAVAIP